MRKSDKEYLIVENFVHDNFTAGTDIREVIPHVIALADEFKKPVVFKFNDISLVVTGKSKAKDILDQFHKKCENSKRYPKTHKRKAEQKFSEIKRERQIKEALEQLKHTIIKPVSVPNKAVFPIEVVQTLKRFKNLPPDSIPEGRAVPSFDSSRKRSEIVLVEADQLIQPLLDRIELYQTLRTIDLFNGCKHRCDTCLADSVFPTKGFSTESMERLLYDPRFQHMLQPDSLRFGSTGDPLDHSDWLDILQTTLKVTGRISENYKIKIFTNYRPKREHQIDQLIELAEKNPSRIDVVVSLPFNRNDIINEKFKDYHKHWNVQNADISVQSVREPRLLFMTGRKLSPEVNAGRIEEYNFIGGDRVPGFRHRGFAKTFLNPDALWLKIYATGYESHTTNVFVPITPKNIHALSSLPYHPDFPVPPHWPGGVGKKKSWEEARMLAEQAQETQTLRPCTVVQSFPANRKVVPFCARAAQMSHKAASSSQGQASQTRQARGK